MLVGLLYARPLQQLLRRRSTTSRAARADVQALQAEKRELQHRLAESSTGEALTAQARRLGLVRPGEQLFIVKGLSALGAQQQGYARRSGGR